MKKSICLVLLSLFATPAIAQYEPLSIDILGGYHYIDTANISCSKNSCKAYHQMKEPTGKKDKQGFEIYYVRYKSLRLVSCLDHTFRTIESIEFDKKGNIVQITNDQAVHSVMPGSGIADFEEAACKKVPGYKPLKT